MVSRLEKETNPVRLCLRTFALSVAFLAVVYAPPAQGQSQSQPAPESSSQSAQPATQAKAKVQTQSAAEPQMQVVPGAQQDSLADAARKAKAQKANSPTARVMTDDDVSRIGSAGVSVVGGGTTGARSFGASGRPEAPAAAGGSAASGSSDERYWRGRAREILDEFSATDQQIASLKAEIAKSGPTGVDPSTGLTQNVIIIHDRNAQVKHLEERKAILQRRLEDLTDEGRKAGADSSWFR